MQKMTLQDLKALFPKYTPKGKAIRSATSKNAEHIVNPVWLPGKTLAPSVYRHNHLAKPVHKIIRHSVNVENVAKRNLVPSPIRVDYPVAQNKQATITGYIKGFGSSPA